MPEYCRVFLHVGISGFRAFALSSGAGSPTRWASMSQGRAASAAEHHKAAEYQFNTCERAHVQPDIIS